jgi:hypothetical protein
MEMNTLQDSFFLSTLYDIAKFFVGYVIGRLVYDQYLLDWRWGGWRLIVKRGDEPLTKRELSSEFGRRIRTDDNEFSVYVKGVVSPYEYLNIDICSEKAKHIGLISHPVLGRFDLPRNKRELVVDLAKNPPKEQNSRKPL